MFAVVKAPIFLAEGISCFATHLLPLRCVYSPDWSITPAKMRAVNWPSSAVLTSLIIAQPHRICAAPRPKWTRLFPSQRWKTVYFGGCKIFNASANTNNLEGHKDLPNTKCILAFSLSLRSVRHFVCLWHFLSINLIYFYSTKSQPKGSHSAFSKYICLLSIMFLLWRSHWLTLWKKWNFSFQREGEYVGIKNLYLYIYIYCIISRDWQNLS